MEGGDQKRVGDHGSGRTTAGGYPQEIILGVFEYSFMKLNKNRKGPGDNPQGLLSFVDNFFDC